LVWESFCMASEMPPSVFETRRPSIQAGMLRSQGPIKAPKAAAAIWPFP